MADFDMEDELPGPTVIQAPGWAQEDGHDLPISPEKPAIHEKLQVVLDAAPLGSDHALVRERIGPYDTHLPIYPGATSGKPPSNTDRSWLGALLMALFNLSPFLNFIEEAANNKAFNDHIFIGLHSLAQSFHRRGNDQLEDEEWEQDLWSGIQTFWQCIKTEGPNGGEPFPDQYCHVPEFLHYLFDRLERAQLLQNQAGGGDDVNLSTRFMQLFKYFTVRLTPMRCSCKELVLRRQPTGHHQPNGYTLTAQITEGMNLEQAISRAMWENETEPNTRTCPECGDEVDAVDFSTFAYLPEVFFIVPIFMSKRCGDRTVRYTSDEKFIYPERLDMSALTDDPERPGDQTDRIYKLQSIVTCTDQDLGRTTSYKASLRLSDYEWIRYGYTAGPGPSYVSFEEINDPGRRETSEEAPNLLVYVRDHHFEGSGILDEVKPQQAPPQSNTEIHDEYGLESSDVERFVRAQDQPGENANATAFENAKSELRRGRKTSHWMWYMFPQVFRGRMSRLGELYAIKSTGEAFAYWKNSLLKSRYLSLLNIVLEGSQTDLKELFGGQMDAEKFRASLTLFELTCDEEERDLFQQVFKKFDMHLHEETKSELAEWLDHGGEREKSTWFEYPSDDSGGDGGNQETYMPDQEGIITPTEYLEYYEPPPERGDGDHHGGFIQTDGGNVFAQNLGVRLGKLSDTDVDDTGLDANLVAEYNERGRLLGLVIMGLAYAGGQTPPVDESHYQESARRLGRNLFLLSKPAAEPDAEADVDTDIGDPDKDNDNDDPEDDLAKDDNYKPDSGNPPDDGYEPSDTRPTDDDSGLDDTSESPAVCAAHFIEEEPHEAVAIPTDPNDPRINACQSWTLKKLKSEFQKEQIDWRGLRSDTKKHRAKFLKHFEIERDYSIYHVSRLREAAEERAIAVSSGATKNELVDVLTEYDTQKLGEMEFVEDDAEPTDSAEFESEEYQSSEAPETDASSANEATPRPKKRLRFEYEEEDEIDEDDGDDNDADRDYGDEDMTGT